MEENTRTWILEQFGENALERIENENDGYEDALVYADGYTFEIIGFLSCGSMTVDEVLDFLGIDMDEWADRHGWDGWDFEALQLIGIR